MSDLFKYFPILIDEAWSDSSMPMPIVTTVVPSSKSQISKLLFFMHNTFHTEWYWMYMWYLHKYCE